MNFFTKIKAFFRPAPIETLTLKQLPPVFGPLVARSGSQVVAQTSVQLPQDAASKIYSCLPSDVANSVMLQVDQGTIEVMENEYGEVAAIPAKYPASDDEPFFDLMDGQMKSSWDFLFVTKGNRSSNSMSVEDFTEEQCAVRLAQKIMALHERSIVIGLFGAPKVEVLPGGRARLTVNVFTSIVVSQAEVDKV